MYNCSNCGFAVKKEDGSIDCCKRKSDGVIVPINKEASLIDCPSHYLLKYGMFEHIYSEIKEEIHDSIYNEIKSEMREDIIEELCGYDDE